jgi:hypothetical protein
MTRRRIFEATLPWAAALVGTFLYHRYTILGGLDPVQADTGDSRFIAFLLEHWNAALQGHAPWRSPLIFYPVKGTLGYSDALLAMGGLHIALRHSGLGVFTAMNLQLILWSGLTFAACYTFLRRGFDFAVPYACAGAYFFAFGWPRFAQLVHEQLQFTVLLPLMALLALRFLRDGAALTRWHDFRLLAGLVLMTVLLLVTATYYALFFALALAIALLLCLLLTGTRSHCLGVLRRSLLPIAGAGLLMAVLLIPVAEIYLPVVRLSSGRNWPEVSSYLVDPQDLLWMGRENFVWGSLFNLFPARAERNWPEWRIGTGLVMTVLWLMAIAWSLRLCWLWRTCRASIVLRDGIVAIVILTGAILQASMLRLPSGGSLWWLIYEGFPGMGGIRAVPRLQLLVTMAMAVALALMAERAWQLGTTRRWLRPALLCVFGFACVEQLGTSYLYSARQAEALAIRVAAAVPAACRAFYVVAPPRAAGLAGGPSEAAMRTAMSYFYRYTVGLSATLLGKPTVNGLSGYTPPGYDLEDVLAPDAPARLARWLSHWGIRQDSVCLVPIQIDLSDLPQRTGRFWQ